MQGLNLAGDIEMAQTRVGRYRWQGERLVGGGGGVWPAGSGMHLADGVWRCGVKVR